MRQAGDEVIEDLARTLYLTMEHLDPTGEYDWEKLSDRQKEFYRLSITGLLRERALLISALNPR